MTVNIFENGILTKTFYFLFLYLKRIDNFTTFLNSIHNQFFHFVISTRGRDGNHPFSEPVSDDPFFLVGPFYHVQHHVNPQTHFASFIK
jgi:hypothetical protein